MNSSIIPTRLHLKKTEQLEIDWQDGLKSVYPIVHLRTMCPCAQCKIVRERVDPHDISPGEKKKPLLTILPGNFAAPITVVSAERVGNYAIRIDWSDDHGSGIYSYQYLREISPQR